MRSRASRRAGGGNGGGTPSNGSSEHTNIGRNNCTFLTIAIMDLLIQEDLKDPHDPCRRT